MTQGPFGFTIETVGLGRATRRDVLGKLHFPVLPTGTFVQNTHLLSRDIKDERSQIGARPVSIDELAHDLRQPLGAIESLAYYLELRSPDDSVCHHLEQIRNMVNRASLILERASREECSRI